MSGIPAAVEARKGTDGGPAGRLVSWAEIGWVAGLALLAVGLYVGATAAADSLGFPLDDSWIHQTYARNLAQNGRWEFVPGTASAGSTSPSWSVALAAGYLIGFPYLTWAYLLGWLCLVWLCLGGLRLWRLLWPGQAGGGRLIAAALALSWPLVWAAGSGMETLLFTALGLELLVQYASQVRSEVWRPGRLGLLAGAAVLTRPEGVLLGLLVAAAMLLRTGAGAGGRVGRIARYGIAAAVVLAPYFALNLVSGAGMWPNTFYAKQAEYAVLWQTPLPLRFARLLYFSLGGPEAGWRGISGAQLVLLPGLLMAAWQSGRADWRARQGLYALPLLWAAGHLLLFAWRLPVTYHHGRYLWPVLPVIVLYGLAGWQAIGGLLGQRYAGSARLSWAAGRAGRLIFAVLLLFFLALGWQVYREDVAFINHEMVDAALWLRDKTPAESLIAAHDIGAIGFFAGRPLVDLAGLVTPEVIPLLGDDKALSDYVRASAADYLVTAPGWPYQMLARTEAAEPVYSTDYAWTREQGLNNVTIYRLRR